MHPEMAGSVSLTKPDFAVWLLPSIKSGPLRSFAQGRSINSVPAEGPPNRGPEPSRSSTEFKTSSGRAKLHGAASSNCAPAWLDGVARGAEEERLNHGGSRAEMCMHDRDNLGRPLGGGARGQLQGWIRTRPALRTRPPSRHCTTKQ